MSAPDNSQVSPADVAAPTKETLCAQLQKSPWKDHGKQLHQYILSGPTAIYSHPAMICALLQLFGDPCTLIDPEFDDIILLFINSLGGLLSVRVANYFLTTLLPSADLKRCRYVVGRLIQRYPGYILPPLRKTPLDDAALQGALSNVQSLVAESSNGLALLGYNKNGYTPLSLACMNGHTEVAKYLLKLAPEASFLRDIKGYNLWHLSAEKGHLAILEILVGELEKENQRSTKHTALDDASRREDITTSSCFDMSVASALNRQGPNRQTLLHLACKNNHLKVVDFLLSKAADPTKFDRHGKTCLQVALERGYIDIGERLLLEQAVKKDLNEVEYPPGSSLLSIACTNMESDAVDLLLRFGARYDVQNVRGSTPITETIKSGKQEMLSKLLSSDHFQSNPPVEIMSFPDFDKRTTTLHFACQYDNLDALKLLLNKGVPANVGDWHLSTALHYSSLYGMHSFVVALLDKYSPGMNVNERDDKGRSAFHLAAQYLPGDSPLYWDRQHSFLDSRRKKDHGLYQEVISELVKHGANWWLPTEKDKDLVIHVAARVGSKDRVSYLLSLFEKDGDNDLQKFLQTTNELNETALHCALIAKKADVSELLAKKMTSIDFDNTRHGHTMLDWLTEIPERHDIISEILFKESYGQFRDCGGVALDTLGWSAYSGCAKLVRLLLQNTLPGPVRDYSITRAIDAVHRVIQEHRLAHCEESTSDTRTREGVMADAGNESTVAGQDNSVADRAFIASKDILEILHNPPATVRPPRERQPKQWPEYDSNTQPAEFVDKYRVELVDCFDYSLLRRSVSIKEALYIDGPIGIMKVASQRTRELRAESKQEQEEDGGVREDTPNVMWIHLPANNMKWHEHACLKVNSEFDNNEVKSKSKTDDAEDNFEWLSTSWAEVVGSGRETSFMKPLCTARVDNSNGKIKCAAVYMPYTAPAWCHVGKIDDRLLSHYKSHNHVIHGPRTLDEYFYHCCRLENAEKTMKDRNGDQVLSKTLHEKLCDRSDWILVNVDQLWIWIVNETTVITSATHRRDGEHDPVFTTTLDDLQKAIDKSGNIPRDAVTMANLIMSTCINMLHTPFLMNTSPRGAQPSSLPSEPPVPASNLGMDSRKPEDLSKGSIRPAQSDSIDLPETRTVCISEIFANATAEAAVAESRLYQRFIEKQRIDSGRSLARGARSPSSPDDRIETAQLFREIKDIRDELKMLRVIAESQRSVQKEFHALTDMQPQAVGSKDIVDDLQEMDKTVEQIETAVNITLNLQHNAAAIAQTDAAVYQGQIILLFTVVTIVFLPMSYFTSLFAVQVDSFLKTPPWAFGVMFGASALISVTLAVYAFYSDAANTTVARTWECLRRWLVKLTNDLHARLAIWLSPVVEKWRSGSGHSHPSDLKDRDSLDSDRNYPDKNHLNSNDSDTHHPGTHRSDTHHSSTHRSDSDILLAMPDIMPYRNLRQRAGSLPHHGSKDVPRFKAARSASIPLKWSPELQNYLPFRKSQAEFSPV